MRDRCIAGRLAAGALFLVLLVPAVAAAGGRFVPGVRSPGLRTPTIVAPFRSGAPAGGRIRFGTLLGPGGARHTTLVGTGTTPIYRAIPQGGQPALSSRPLPRPIFVTVGETLYQIQVSGDVLIVIDE